ncbi:MAG: hypothetical protein WDA42_00825 [Candidatus Bathyarchaeia archaeon]
MPQLILIAVLSLSIGVNAALVAVDERDPAHFVAALLRFIAINILLWWGGWYS